MKSVVESMSQWMSLIVFGGFLGYFALIFRAYKQVVESHQKLTELLNDPKVRVASGDQANHILQAA